MFLTLLTYNSHWYVWYKWNIKVFVAFIKYDLISPLIPYCEFFNHAASLTSNFIFFAIYEKLKTATQHCKYFNSHLFILPECVTFPNNLQQLYSNLISMSWMIHQQQKLFPMIPYVIFNLFQFIFVSISSSKCNVFALFLVYCTHSSPFYPIQIRDNKAKLKVFFHDKSLYFKIIVFDCIILMLRK